MLQDDCNPAMPVPPHRIALVDGNNFYASCERVFNPAWINKPLGVLSNNDGCIVARSNELKAAGIPMGAPYFQYRDQLKAMGAIIVSSNYTLYGDMSARMMHTLAGCTPDLDVYSIDEAWLDLTGIDDDLTDYGQNIVQRVQQHIGLPVSIGIGPTRVLAKLANRLCKKLAVPGQVFDISTTPYLDDLLGSVPVGDLWGIGRNLAQSLQDRGIFTARHLRDADPQSMRKGFNVIMQRMIMELRGIPCLHKDDIGPKRQIISSRSFGTRVTDKQSLLESVSMHASRAGQKLRDQGSACGGMHISIRTGRHNIRDAFYANSTQIIFPIATADTRKLIAAACRGVEQMYRPGYRYAKAGIMLFDLRPADRVQGNLFEAPDTPRSQAFMALVDQVNRKHGRNCLFFGAEGITKSWGMKQEGRTAAFTTCWDQLPSVS